MRQVPFSKEDLLQGKLRTGIQSTRKSLEREGWGLGKGGKSFSSEKFSLPSPIFHFYFPINPAISSRRTRAAASAAMRSSSF